jgi:eukaryotic-like serine/threonine-protein kinase
VHTRYRLGDIIASGGMAEVYRAHDKFLGRDVAVKVFRASATAEIDFQRQKDEVDVLARLSHPNLVTLFDAAVDRSDPNSTRIYYVMELVEGTDLKRRLDTGPMVPRQIAQVGYSAAVALEYVHSRGIVHRDVKPANILLTLNADGTRVTARLSDFGVASIGPARPIDDDEVVTGTVAYLSPEQARGEEVGPATDVYALGLVLLQCFTRTLAFPGPPQHSAMSRLLEDPDIPDAVPSKWVPLLSAMTAREASDRPDIHDVAQALRQMFAAESGKHRADAEGAGGDAERSEDMQHHDLLGELPSDAFDRVASLAARVLKAPIAMVSIVDHERVWLTSSQNLDLAEITHDPRPYAAAILRDEPWIIEDALAEPRAVDNPLVAGDSGLRFYAGVPLTASDGIGIGTVCVLDVAPRTISDEELAILADLSALVVRELEIRREARSIRHDHARESAGREAVGV